MHRRICSGPNILSTNRPWREFGLANGGSAALNDGGQNYLTVCDKATGKWSGGAQMAHRIRAVIQGRQDKFEREYPCDSPTEKRVFRARVTRCEYEGVVERAMLALDDGTEKPALPAKASLAERHLASVVASANDLVLSTDRQGRMAHAGTLIPVDWSFSPIPDENGQAIGVVVVVRDLSARLLRRRQHGADQPDDSSALPQQAGWRPGAGVLY